VWAGEVAGPPPVKAAVQGRLGNERWVASPPADPRAGLQCQGGYNDVFSQAIHVGNVVFVRSQEGLENYSSTLQGLLHKHVPQGAQCDAF